jgi:NitT/TauT family transport system substrate-binding protein
MSQHVRSKLRTAAQVAVAGALVATMAACGGGSGTSSGSSASSTSITFGVVSPNATQLGLLQLASDAGYFKDVGLDVTIKVLSSGTLRTAVAGGAVQFATFGAPSGELLVLNKAPVTIIGDPIPTSLFGLVVGPGIKSPGQLRGKAVGVSSSGSADELYLANCLAAAGLSLSDIKLVLNQETALAPIFASGGLDSLPASEPQSNAAAASRAGSSVIHPATGGVSLPQTEVVAYEPYLKAHEDVAVKVLEAITRAGQLFKSDKAKTETVLQKNSKGTLSGKDLDETYNSVAGAISAQSVPTQVTEQHVLQSLDRLGGQFAKEAGAGDPSAMITTKYMTQALAALHQK